MCTCTQCEVQFEGKHPEIQINGKVLCFCLAKYPTHSTQDCLAEYLGRMRARGETILQYRPVAAAS